MQRLIRRAAPCAVLTIAFHAFLVSTIHANTGTQLPLNQYQAGTEEATLVTNGDFESHDGTNPTGWAPVGEIAIGTTPINPPANGGALGASTVQAKYVPGADTDRDVLRLGNPGDPTVLTFDQTKQYTLSAYVWNFGADPPGDPDWELSIVELVPFQGSDVKNVALDWQTDEGLPGSDGYLIHTTFEGSFFPSGAVLDVIFDAANSNPNARPRPDQIAAQFDNVSITEVPLFVRPATNSTWKLNAGGVWTPNASWVAGVVPNGKSDWATFGPTILTDSIVTVDGDKTVGRLNFNSASRYTLSGSTITVDTRAGATAGAQVNVLGGSHTIDAPLHLAVGTEFNVDNAADTLSVSNLTAAPSGVTITKSGAGKVVANQIVADGLAVGAGTMEVPTNGGPTGTVRVKSLSVTGGALQLNDNDLIIDYTGTSPEAAIRQRVKDARVVGATSGIFVAPGSPDDDKVLAVADNTFWGKPSFNGFGIDGSTVVGKYTYFGDANLDGKVTGDDYVSVDANLGTGDSWLEGDFNMNGVTTGDDYVAIDANLGKGTPDPLAYAELKEEMVAAHVAMFGEEYLVLLAKAEAEGFGASVVPEPGTASLLLVGIIGIGMRNRRRGR